MTKTKMRHSIVPLIVFGLACVSACNEEAGNSETAQPFANAQVQTRMQQLQRNLETAEALRAVEHLQWAYGHYSEFGLWHDFADLFADTGIGHYVQGDLDREGIRALFLDQVGQGQLGLAEGRIYPHISFAPVLTVAPDGTSIHGRFRILAMLGGYGGNALWFHGVYENVYVQERGVWKINEIANAAQITGTFTAGLSASATTTNDPVQAFHFTPEAVIGFNVSSASTAATTPKDQQQLASELAVLQQRLDRIVDEAAILNLQHQYAYYLDNKDWDALAGLFAEQGSLELGHSGVYHSKKSIRRFLDLLGNVGLESGVVADHFLFQPYVSIAPDGNRAHMRLGQLGIEGTAGVGGSWSQGNYENRYVKENGQWRIEALHYYPRLITGYDKGWGVDAQQAPGPSATMPPDAPSTEQYALYPAFYIPALHFNHPVTGRPPQYPAGDPATGRTFGFDAVDAPVPGNMSADELLLQLADAENSVKRTLARSAVTNLVNAYAFYLDECMTDAAAQLFTNDGEHGIPGIGMYRGRERIAASMQMAWCADDQEPGSFTLHHALQPVVEVASDGLSASFISRLWQVHAATTGEDYYLAGQLEGTAQNSNGQWQLSSLQTRYRWVSTTDEGWAPASNNDSLGYAASAAMLSDYAPDRTDDSLRLAPVP